ncbi:Murein DD-endopeptidase MepM and murein hydrolase activator NlpD [Pseudomonas syringae pv. actinidiae]|uniref:Murein DD-endopeptidase MepM and murein hydrolase activator NlpD n=1 Tax=Pseudomonas syringae pv. actinidiae TaxID=103796 RepID=A0A2V0QJ47_PSESF|nr:Murein DD-endopeptidase MepM and murein hydrolase activator NlpD [Pseudomonas syringae pv. actinidiae]
MTEQLRAQAFRLDKRDTAGAYGAAGLGEIVPRHQAFARPDLKSVPPVSRVARYRFRDLIPGQAVACDWFCTPDAEQRRRRLAIGEQRFQRRRMIRLDAHAVSQPLVEISRKAVYQKPEQRLPAHACSPAGNELIR